MASIEKRHGHSTYKVYVKGLEEASLRIKYLEEEIYQRSFNTERQGFWPEDDDIAMRVLEKRLNMTGQEKVMVMPFGNIYWLPRLMQTYQGFISVFDRNDAVLHLLFANLAGTTLHAAHLTFTQNPFQAFQRTFHLADLSPVSELRSFQVDKFQLTFANQDIDLNMWPNVKQVNLFADESIWVEGCTLKLVLSL